MGQLMETVCLFSNVFLVALFSLFSLESLSVFSVNSDTLHDDIVDLNSPTFCLTHIDSEVGRPT